jgi:hypothetical protein
LFCSTFPIKIMCIFLMSAMGSASYASLTDLDFISQAAFREKYELWNSPASCQLLCLGLKYLIEDPILNNARSVFFP